MKPAKARPAADILRDCIAWGLWPEGATMERHELGHLVTFPNGRRRMILNQRELSRAYRSTRRYPSIQHAQVQTWGDA